MEDTTQKTTGSLAKDFNVLLLPTKAMQKVVTSIASKVTYLIVASSDVKDDSSDQSTNHNEVLFADLVSSAESILEALKDMIKVTNQTVEVGYPHDESILEEAEVASQNLLISGENLLLCCQVLASTAAYKSKSTTEAEYPNFDLTSSISKCFQSLVVLLMCIDNAEVRLLVNLGNSVLERLTLLTAAKSQEKLIEYFHVFAVSIHNFHIRSSQRSEDLLSSSIQTKLNKNLTALKHSMPMLSTALNLSIKYPENAEASSSRIFAVQQVEKTITEIIELIKARPNEPVWSGEAHIGLLASYIRSIDNGLSPENRYDVDGLELETLVQSLVQHLMAISTYISKNVECLMKRSSNLVKECQKLIELINAVIKMSPNQSLHRNLSSNADDSSEYGSVCRVVRRKLKSLTKLTHSIVISLLSHAFIITTEPLTGHLRVHRLAKQNHTSQMIQKLKASCSSFKSHCNNISQVSRFISTCCSDSKLYGDLESRISHFDTLSSQIVQCSLNLSSNFTTNVVNSSNEASISSLSKEWSDALTSLLHCCSSTLDLTQLTTSIECEISSDFDKCHEDIVNLDDVSLSKHVINTTGKAKLLAMVAEGVVSASFDPVYRNGVTSHVKQLHDAIAHVIGSGNLLIEDTARLPSQEAFLSSASFLKTKTEAVRIALLSSSNHPQLTSDDRVGLRDFSDSDKISGMIKEMHNLNRKLAALGFDAKVSAIDFDPEEETLKHSSELVDGLLGTSGPPVDLDSPTNSVTEIEQNGSREMSSMHPVADKLIRACRNPNQNRSITTCVTAIMETTSHMNQIITDGHSCFTTSKLLVNDASTCPVYAVNQESSTESCSIVEAMEAWKKNLNESCSLIEVCVKEEDVETELLCSLCDSWSKSFRNITECCLKVLGIYLLCFRRYLQISETSVKSSPSSKKSVTDDEQSSNDIHFVLEKPHGGILMLGRVSRALCILLEDVINLQKRELSNNTDKEKVASITTRLNVLLCRTQEMAVNLNNARKKLSEQATVIEKDGLVEPEDIALLHVYSLVCAAKLCSLSVTIETTLQLVLGVRKLKFPVHYFIDGNVRSLKLLKEYGGKMRLLATSAVEKTNQVISHRNLDIEEVTKLQKVRDRIEASYGSIENILEFVLLQKFSDSLLLNHGYIIYHLTFLHQKLSLEVARIFLVTKLLSNIADSNGDTSHKRDIRSVASGGQPKSKNYDPAINQANASPESQRFAERLAALTRERKEREKDLFYLLSDIDVEKGPADTQEDHVLPKDNNSSQC